jgi:hypothetical protein
MAGIANGSIPSHVDGQFLFVDLKGLGILPTARRAETTESVVTKEEFAALTFQPRGIEEEPALDEEESGGARDVGSWRSGREESVRMRRPPRADAA